MRRPRIGFVAYNPVKDPTRFVAPIDYIQAVERAGADVVIVPPGPSAAHLLDLVQGLVLIGGGDICPSRYSAQPHAACYGIDAVRDSTELTVLEAAVKTRHPLLAICRGMQLINVALGGTLHQHLPEVVGDKVTHRVVRESTGLVAVDHEVRLEPSCLVAQVCGASRITIASTHHQAVDRLGTGVRAVGWADDGVVEAISVDGHPQILAVQWHPELKAAEDPRQQGLFDWLVQQANGTRQAA
jgi:putative glutamine amidotransferase